MKKSRYIISGILILLLNSCIVERYEAPRKTTPGYHLFLSANSCLFKYVNMYNTCENIDKWIDAQTNQEKYEIEDTYFPKLKVREYGDTIEVADYYVLNQEKGIFDKSWRVFESRTDNYYYYDIRVKDEDLSIVYNNDSTAFSTELILKLKRELTESPEDSTVAFYRFTELTGHGILKENDYDMMFNIDIKEPLMFDLSYDNTVLRRQSFLFMSGEIDVKSFYFNFPNEGDSVSVIFLSDYEEEITYKIFNDKYGQVYNSLIPF